MYIKRIKRAPMIAYLCLLPILLALGFWQLQRADEKREMIRLQDRRQHAEPVLLTSGLKLPVEEIIYTPVKLAGHFDNAHQFLLDNQVVDGKAGYFVLTPLQLNNQDMALLVNRGWLPLAENRNKLPVIPVTTEQINITGIINRFPKPGLILSGAEIPSNTWPASLQIVDIKILQKLLGYSLYDFQVELDPAAPYGYKREWTHRQTMPPEKHLAYAGQWFLLALLLTFLFFKYGLQKNG